MTMVRFAQLDPLEIAIALFGTAFFVALCMAL